MVKKSIASKYKHFDYVVCPNNLFLKFSNELIINVWFVQYLFWLQAAGNAMFIDGTAAIALARITDVTLWVIHTTSSWWQ